MVQTETVHVPLDGGRAYDILIGRGLLAGIGPRVAALKARAVGVVSDETVAAEYGEAVTASLEQAGLRTTLIAVAPGEGSKSYAGFAQVCDGLIAHRIERGDLVLALGGGVVGDLAGFAAASLRRGVRFVQAPTTLLAHFSFQTKAVTSGSARARPAWRHARAAFVARFHVPG